MAIQQIEKQEVKGSAGIKRKINAAAEGLIMDIVQVQQYTKPIPSTVRELTANAVDSQSEKLRALEILSGKVSPDKYFIKRSGVLYDDSNWDPNYYDPAHLNTKNNSVTLTYRSIEGSGRCDSFIVRDEGVGIGQSRLEGIVSVGFSTKRNRTDALGSYGLGAKVGLATGADYYKMTTVYNGVKYSIQIFDRKLNSLIGPLNLDTGEQNVIYEFSEGGEIYGQKTDEKNYTEIEVPSLKHYRSDFITAVKTQLLYFKNVDFTVEEVFSNGEVDKERIDFQADVIHNSENLIISNRSPFSQPHIVIVKGAGGADDTGVCYGTIDFKELELEEMRGDIGIKCPIRQVTTDENGDEVVINDGVDTIPSREAVRWTPATREFIKKKFALAQDEATGLVEKELLETEFIPWLRSCMSVTMRANSDSVIGRLSRMVDLKNLKPTFKGKSDQPIAFGGVNELFQGFQVRSNAKYKEKDKFQVRREERWGWSDVKLDALYLKQSNTARTKDLYITDQHDGIFTSLMPLEDGVIEKEVQDLISNNKIRFKDKESVIEARIAHREAVLKLLLADEAVISYEELEVPEDYLTALDKVEAEMEEASAPELTPAQKRALENRIPAHTLVPRYSSYWTDNSATYKESKVEPKIKDIDEYKGTLYYGTQADRTKIQYAAHILDSINGIEDFYNADFRLVSVAQNNVKHFKSHSHINDFFGKPELIKENNEIKGVGIMLDNRVTKWNTARKIHPFIAELVCLENYESFDQEIFDKYKKLKQFASDHYSSLDRYSDRLGVSEHHGGFVEFLDALQKLQEFTKEESDAEKIKDYVANLVDGSDVNLPENTIKGLAVDLEMLDLLEELLAYVAPVKELLKEIPMMTSPGRSIPLESSMLMKEYLTFKKLLK